MAPRKFFPSVSEKPSWYLHYWYKNAENVGHDLLADFQLSKQQILTGQLKNFKQRRANQIAKARTQGLEIGAFLDAMDANPNFLAEEMADWGLNASGTTASESGGSLEAAADEYLAQLNKAQGWISEADEIVRALVTPLLEMFKPEQIREYQKALIADYVAQTADKKTGATMTTSQAASRIINDFMQRNANKTIDISQLSGGGVNLTNSQKRALLLLEAVDVSLKDGTSLGSITGGSYVSKSGGAQNNLSESELWQAFSKKGRGLGHNVASNGHELAVSQAVNKAAAEFFGAVEKTGQAIKAQNGRSIGNEVIQITQIYHHNNTLSEVYRRAEGARKVSVKTYKADAGITVVDGNVTVELGGISAKKGVSWTPDPIIGGSIPHIKIQDSTPLSMLLAREIGLSGAQYFSLIQFLVGHGSNGRNLAKLWDDLKEKLIYQGFLNALMGVYEKEAAFYMVIGNQIYSMGYILDQVISSLNKPKNWTAMIGTTVSNEAGLDKATYESFNEWIEPNNAPNFEAAAQRSGIAYGKAAGELWRTKITYNIILNANTLMSFLT